MGWTSFYKPSHTSTKDFFEKEYGFGPDYELLKVAIKNFSTVYMAVRYKPKDYVICFVCLVTYSPKSRYNFSYKEMTEFEGPVRRECPENILKLLTPLEEIAKKDGKDVNDYPYQYAKNWRQDCWDNLKKRKSKPRISNGTIIKLSESVKFSDGNSYDLFQKVGRSFFTVRIHEGKAVPMIRVSFNPRKYEYEVVEAGK